MATKGRPVTHSRCFVSSNSRTSYIGKAYSALSALWVYRKHPSQSTEVFRVEGRLKLFRPTSRKQGTVPFWPLSQTPTYAISIVHVDGAKQR
jgi:hypothetical protein